MKRCWTKQVRVCCLPLCIRIFFFFYGFDQFLICDRQISRKDQRKNSETTTRRKTTSAWQRAKILWADRSKMISIMCQWKWYHHWGDSTCRNRQQSIYLFPSFHPTSSLFNNYYFFALNGRGIYEEYLYETSKLLVHSWSPCALLFITLHLVFYDIYIRELCYFVRRPWCNSIFLFKFSFLSILSGKEWSVTQLLDKRHLVKFTAYKSTIAFFFFGFHNVY